MIPNIIRLQEQAKELTERIITLEARGALADAHIENLIGRMYDLETWLERHNIDYHNHVNTDCTCGWGGQHDPDNPRCARNKGSGPLLPPFL